jgi:Lhr-like helicase
MYYLSFCPFDYIHVTSNRPNTIYATHQVENSIMIDDTHNYEHFLKSPYDTNSQPHVLIFVDDKKLTTKIEMHLESCLPPQERGKGIIHYYHSSMSKTYLETVHEDFISPTGTCKILIATSGESVVKAQYFRITSLSILIGFCRASIFQMSKPFVQLAFQ